MKNMDRAASPNDLLASLDVLVVDDQRLNREWLHAGLRHRVAKIALAASGEEALERCRQEAFDVVLMDLHLPGMDGRATADSICDLTTHPSRPRLIAVTADARESTREQLLGVGFDACLSKPVGLDTVAGAIERLFAAEGPHDSPPTDPDSPELIDHERARRAANGDSALVDRLQFMLANEIRARRPDIERCLLQADAAGAAEVLHQWIGACGYAGAERLAQDCAELRDALAGENSLCRAEACVRFLRTAEGTRSRLEAHCDPAARGVASQPASMSRRISRTA
jgi:two-component system sensor histidine kinase BarA